MAGVISQTAYSPSTGILIFLAVSVGLIVLGLMLHRLYTAVMCYVVLPLRNRGNACPASVELPESEVQRLPTEQREALEAARAPLERCRFSLAAFGRAVDENIATVGSTWLNERDGTSALVMATRVQIPDFPAVVSVVVSFCTEFSDNSALVTVNDSPHCFPPDPHCDTLRWPGMYDIELLYRLHAARVARDRGGLNTKLPSADEVIRYTAAADTKTLWRYVEAGYLWFDAGDGVFRRALKGALLMSWRMLWPWNQRLAASSDRKLRRELQLLGMGVPEDYRPDPQDSPARPALSYVTSGSE